jgi:hypothetical protein
VLITANGVVKVIYSDGLWMIFQTGVCVLAITLLSFAVRQIMVLRDGTR